MKKLLVLLLCNVNFIIFSQNSDLGYYMGIKMGMKIDEVEKILDDKNIYYNLSKGLSVSIIGFNHYKSFKRPAISAFYDDDNRLVYSIESKKLRFKMSDSEEIVLYFGNDILYQAEKIIKKYKGIDLKGELNRLIAKYGICSEETFEDIRGKESSEYQFYLWRKENLAVELIMEVVKDKKGKIKDIESISVSALDFSMPLQWEKTLNDKKDEYVRTKDLKKP